MTLTVLSAIARQDIDPWTEAARLAQLPVRAAVPEIRRLLDALPPRIVAGLDTLEAASRLSALLPRRLASNPSGSPDTAPVEGTGNPTSWAFNWRAFYIYVCFMVLMNWLLAEPHSPPPTAGGTGTSATASAARPPIK